LNIQYEDESVLVVDKSPGMVVHPAYANYTGTLVNALAFYLQNKSPDKAPDRFPFLVHRIDKDTSGLLLVAKDEESQSKLARQFYNHSIERKYMALVWGNIDEEDGKIEGNIGRSPSDRRIFTVYDDPERGKHAVTHYKVIERFGYITCVECQLETGRTHQIRVHFRHIGHPLFGDKSYGGDQILKGTTFTKYKQFVNNCFKILPRQALHAKSLGFVHPTTGKTLTFESAVPNDMAEVMEKWRRYTGNREEFED
jgi:23S rRNA pseudouridine1911/1915/1917 synthase